MPARRVNWYAMQSRARDNAMAARQLEVVKTNVATVATATAAVAKPAAFSTAAVEKYEKRLEQEQDRHAGTMPPLVCPMLSICGSAVGMSPVGSPSKKTGAVAFPVVASLPETLWDAVCPHYTSISRLGLPF